MPKVKTKSTAKASGSKKGAAKSQSNGGSRRMAADVDALVPKFLKHLKAGGTMRQLKQEHGFSDDGPIRAALARAGHDSKGGTLALPEIKNSPKAIVKARQEGHPWYIIALVTGKPEAELKKIVKEAGGPTGRVYRQSEKPAKAKASAGKKGTAKAGR